MIWRIQVTDTYGDKTVKRFATDLDIAPGTVYDYRAVAGAYSEAERSDTTSWTVHQVFMREDDRAEPGYRPAGRAVKP